MTMRSVHLWAWSTSQALSFMANDRRRLMTVPFPPVVGNWRRWSHSERLNVISRIWERETGAAIQCNRNSNSAEFILIFSFISVHNLSSMNWIQLTTARLILNTLKIHFPVWKGATIFLEYHKAETWRLTALVKATEKITERNTAFEPSERLWIICYLTTTIQPFALPSFRRWSSWGFWL